MDNNLYDKIANIKEAVKSLQEFHENNAFSLRGHYIGVFIMIEHLLDVLITINICDNIEDERADLLLATMDFIKVDNKITILKYIMNKHYQELLNKDCGFKYLKNENGKNDFIAVLKKAHDIRNTFSHHIINVPEESNSSPLKIKMFKRTGLRENKDDKPEIVEFRNSKSFSLTELKEYTKELINMGSILMELCNERIEKK